MSSAITTALTNMKTRVAAVLTSSDGWKIIPNGYDIPSNADAFLRKGYGIAIAAGANANLLLGNQMSMDRQFTLSLTLETFKTEGNVDGYHSIALALFEALKLVIKDFETNQSLNAGTIFTGYVADDGITTVGGDGDFSFMFLKATFNVKLIEDLN